ncbi:MAG: hypothetical protein OXF02_04595, partial [Simkaniaceae bacterium]|nr:hypothetical protein [Simkaniaceae bacterium]
MSERIRPGSYLTTHSPAIFDMIDREPDEVVSLRGPGRFDRLMKRRIFYHPVFKAFVTTKVLAAPFFWALTLLPYMLRKEFGASDFAIALCIASKPLSAFLAVYWSYSAHGKGGGLLADIARGHILKFIPFLIAPLIHNSWIYIIAFIFHMCLLRGMIPPWMEVLRVHVTGKEQSKACVLETSVNYLSCACLPIIFGRFLDSSQDVLRWFLFVAGGIGILSTRAIYNVPQYSPSREKGQGRGADGSPPLLAPWKAARDLLARRRDFLRFQTGFFFGGGGLMVIHAVLPKYSMGDLALSYMEVTFAISLCKGIGVALSSFVWVKRLTRSTMFSFCSAVPLIGALWSCLLLSAPLHISLYFIAWFVYGVMQGGSELGWKMAGPLFADRSDSVPYSSVSVLAIGVRGALFPFIGMGIGALCGTQTALVTGATFLVAGYAILRTGRCAGSLPA